MLKSTKLNLMQVTEDMQIRLHATLAQSGPRVNWGRGGSRK